MSQNHASDTESHTPHQAGPAGHHGHPHHASLRHAFRDVGELLFGGTANQRFVKGVLVGAAVTAVLTHEQVQRAIIKTALQSYELVASTVEEWKEKVRDAQAELAEQAHPSPTAPTGQPPASASHEAAHEVSTS